jgi:hypothetical protein
MKSFMLRFLDGLGWACVIFTVGLIFGFGLWFSLDILLSLNGRG